MRSKFTCDKDIVVSQPTSVPCKIMDQILLETVLRQGFWLAKDKV